MMARVAEVLRPDGFGEWLTVWLGLILVGAFVVYLVSMAIDDLRKKETAGGLLSLVVAGVVSGLLVWLFLAQGGTIVRQTIATGGPWLRGLPLVVVACIALLPVCLVGHSLWTAIVHAWRRSDGSDARSEWRFAVAGILVIVAVGAVLHFCAPGCVRPYWLLMLCGLVIGAMGGHFIPSVG